MVQRRSGHVTLLDIARACGVSVSTVSIVLSEAPLSRNVAAATRDKVRAMAQTLGYYPDAYARSLRRRRSQMIGVLVYDLSDPFCVPIVRGIQSGLQPASYLPLLMDVQTERKLFDRYLEMALERRTEGLIVIASWVFEESGLLVDVKKNKVPIVIAGRDLTRRGISSVLVDNEKGGALAMRHLYDLGHRRIAAIRGPEEMFDSEPRWAGILKAAAKAGLQFDPRLVFQLPALGDPASGFEGGVHFARQMIATGKPFTAVLAFDDVTALGVIRGLAGAGIRVPEDCSVIGFDDVYLAAMSTPALTTVHQPLNEMGLQAAASILQAFTDRDRGVEHKARLHTANPELVTRMSTAPPPHRAQRGHRT